MASRIKGITIEIDGSVSKLEEALRDVQKELSNSKSALKDIDRLLKLDPKNTELLAQKQKYLGEAADAVRDKLNTEREALKQLEATEGFNKNTEQARALERQIQADAKALKDLEKQAKQASSVMGEQLKATGKQLKEVGDKMTEAGKTATTYVTTPILGAATAAVKLTADFDSSMSKVSAISGATGEDFRALRDKAREMGESTKFSATDAADAMTYMAMAGWKTEDMLGGISGIMNLAAASGEDLATTSDIVTDALTAFGMSAEESGRLADIMAAASNNANTNVSMLGESFKYCAPVAGAMGYKAEDVATALGLMANSGIKASQGGTALRNILTNMAKPTDAMAAAMDELGVSLDDGNGNMLSLREVMVKLRDGFGGLKISQEEYESSLEDLSQQFEDGKLTEDQYAEACEELAGKAFGAEGAMKAQTAAALAGKFGMAGLLAIVGASDEDFDKLTQAIDDSSNEIDGFHGEAEKTAAIMQDNLNGKVTELQSKLSELAISVGDVLMPKIIGVVEKLQSWVDKLNEMDDGQLQTIITIAGVVAAIGPLLMVIGTVISTVGNLMIIGGTLMGLVGGPLTAVIMGLPLIIAAVVAAGIALWKNWDTIKEMASNLVTAIQETWERIKQRTMEAWDAVCTKFTEVWEKIKTFAAEAVEAVKTKISDTWDAIKTKATEIWDSIKTFIQETWNNITSAVSEKVEAVKTKISDTWDSIKTKTTEIWDGIKSFFSDTWEKLKTTASDAAEKVKTTVSEKWEAAKTKTSEAWENIRTTVSNKAEAVRTTVSEKWEAAKTKTSEAWENIKTAVSNKAEAVRSTVANKWEAVKTKTSEAWENARSKMAEKMEAAKTGISTAAESIRSTISSKWETLKSVTGSAWESIKSKIKNPIEEAKNAVHNAIESMKSMFNFSWSLPHLALPHLSISGSFSIMPPSVPSFGISWYKKAMNRPMILDNPTIFGAAGGQLLGAGEAGPEVVSGLGTLLSMIKDAVGSAGTTINQTVTYGDTQINVYGAQGQDIEALADEVEDRMNARYINQKVVWS